LALALGVISFLAVPVSYSVMKDDRSRPQFVGYDRRTPP
jgi:hypothetical protein